MRVLSLFDGISVGKLALSRAGLPVSRYFASEVDTSAIAISTAYHGNNVTQLGDVRGISNVGEIDLLIGGSPCQGFSNIGKGLNFSDPRSKLFFEFLRVLDAVRPRYFMLENVVMRPEWRDIISSYLGVKPRLWCASSVSWQSRPRLWWANFPLEITSFGRGICPVSDGVFGGLRGRPSRRVGQRIEVRRDGLCNCLTTVEKDSIVVFNGRGAGSFFEGSLGIDYRYLTHLEREQLMGLPPGYTYTPFISHANRLRAVGNAWHVDVVSQLFKGIPL